MHTETVCWNCGKVEAGSPFCRFCHHVQAPVPDYFQFLGFERKLSLDASQLQKRFYTMSRQLHPDRYLHASPRDRQYSLEATALLNDAYRVLRDPVSRAEYVLRESVMETGKKNGNMPPELLEEVFELNMAVEELRGGDESVRPQLERARSKFLAMRGEIDAELQKEFEKFDESGERALLADIQNAIHRRRYIQNLVNQVESELSRGE